jgi:hypothetical protein
MMNAIRLLVVVVVVFVVAAEKAAAGSKPCRQLMQEHGMNMSHFANAAAHGIHSLYLEDLR